MKVELAAVINGQQAVGVLDLKKLADQGNIDACNTLGTWLLSGLNCSPNLEQAVYYFEKAAKKGHTTAMINLALCYAEGRGVHKDFDLAEMWIRAADECGDKNANVPARQIYISTIGHHKPNMLEYADYLFQSHYPNGTDLDEKVMKNTLIATMILSEVGVTKDYAELSKMKATENDIASYEIMNDVFYGDPVQPKPGDLSSEEKVAILDGMLTGIIKFDREDIAERSVALYYLTCDAGQKKNIMELGQECKRSFDCPKTPSWLDRARFGIKQSFLGRFSAEAIQEVLATLRSQLNVIEDDELADQLNACGDSVKAIIRARKNLQNSTLYGKDIKTQWLATYSERVAVLQEAKLTEKFETEQNNINALRELFKDISAAETDYESAIIEKWLPIIANRIVALENEELAAKFESAGNDHSELVDLRKTLIAVGSVYAKDTIKHWTAPITDKIVAMESEELSAKYEPIKTDRYAIQRFIRELPKLGYLDQTVCSWREISLSQIMSLEDSEISCRLGQYKTNYADLVRLNEEFKNRAYTTEVIVKWRDKLHSCLCDAQKIALEELCSDLSTKSRDELLAFIQCAEKNYSYDRATLQDFIERIQNAIRVVEQAELDSMMVNAENLSSQELISFKEKLDHLHYTKSVVEPYANLLDGHISRAKVIESCADEILAESDFNALTARKNAVIASNIAADKQTVLVDRIEKYIDLVRNCKDAPTLELLNQCQTAILVTLSVEKLTQIKNRVETHQFIPGEEKSALVSNIEEQITVQTIKENTIQAAGNYDALVSLYNMVRDGKMSPDHRETFEADIRQKIVETQKANLDKISAGVADMSYNQLKKAASQATHYSFDEKLMKHHLSVIYERIDPIEQKRLKEICANLDNSNLDDIQKMRAEIKENGFREENSAPYVAQLNARYADFRYVELVRKCTKETLVTMPLQSLIELLTELKSYVSKKDDAQQNVDRVQELVNIFERRDKALSDLCKQFIPGIINAASASAKSLQGQMMEYYKPEVYIHGEVSLTKYKKYDTFRSLYAADVEKPIFGIYLLNGKNAPTPTLSITNLSVYVGQRKLPIESIVQVKPSRLLGGISLVTATGVIDVHTELPYAGKVHLATAIAEIIHYATDCKRNMQPPLAQIKSTFNRELAACFGEDAPAEAPAAVPPQVSAPVVETPVNGSAPVNTGANPVQVPPVSAPGETETDRYNKMVAQSLDVLNRPWKELSPIQLSNTLAALIIKHNTIRYITYRSAIFEKQIVKAISAYAHIGNDEIALVMEDQTIFSSAKEGFVLTDKNIYINVSGCKNTIVPLSSVTGAFCRRPMGLTDVIISSHRGEYRVSYRSSDAEGNACAAFLNDVIAWLNGSARNCNGQKPEIPSQVNQVMQEQWQCRCGNVNTGNFCSACGGRKEAGVVLWRCACGSLNNGRFCSRCGSPKKE